METPLKHCSKFLNFLHFILLFPSKLDSPNTTILTFSHWSWATTLINYGVIALPMGLLSYTFYISGVPFHDVYTYALNDLGLGIPDFVSVGLLIVLAYLGGVSGLSIYFASYKNFTKFLTEIKTNFEKNLISEEVNKALTRKNMRNIGLVFLAQFIQNIFHSYLIFGILKGIASLSHLEVNASINSLIFVSVGIMIFTQPMVWYHPHTAIMNLLSMQCVGFITAAFDAWADQIPHSKYKTRSEPTFHTKNRISVSKTQLAEETMNLDGLSLSYFIYHGYKLCQLTETCDEAIKHNAISSFIVLVFSLILSFFSSCSLFFKMYAATWVLYIFAVTFILQTLIFCVRLFLFCEAGQDLVESRRLAAIKLEDYLSNSHTHEKEPDFNDSLTKARFLVGRLRDSEPLKPMSLFGLNRSNFLGAQATIITYVTVLLQFKATDITTNATNATVQSHCNITLTN